MHDLFIGITGSRHLKDEARVRAALMPYRCLCVIMIVGDAEGADALARAIGKEFGWAVDAHEAYWEIEGKAAGPNRNQRMAEKLQEAKESGAYTLLFAFPLDESRGTWDMVNKCKRRGIPVTVFR